MFAVREHRIALSRDADAAEFGRNIVEARHFDARDVFEIPSTVRIAAYAIGDVADLSGDVADMRGERLPLLGNALVGLEPVTLAVAVAQERTPFLDARRLQFDLQRIIHCDRLHQRKVVDASLCIGLLPASRFEQIAERAGERLVRTVTRIERHCQNVGCTAGQPARSLARAAWAHA